MRWDSGEDGRETLAALRATYEPLLAGLAEALLLEMPAWMPVNEASDIWQGGHRGLIASRLVEQLADRRETSETTLAGQAPLGRKLRTLLTRG